MMTAITEVTRNASTASRGLSMISSRLVQVLDDSSSTGKKLVKIYGDLGIALKDENGQMRGTYDILKDLAARWDTLSSDQQKYIALTSAGARQTQNFVALMKNFDQAINATAMAYESSGSAAKENEKVMDSIEKKTEVLRSEFQQLVIGDGGLQEFTKRLLDAGLGILKFIGFIDKLNITLVSLAGILLTIKADAIVKSLSSLTTIIPKIRTFIMLLMEAKGAGASFAESFRYATNTAVSSTQFLVGGITLTVTALVALTSAIENYKRKQKEAKDEIVKSIASHREEEQQLQKNIDSIKNENLSREEVVAIVKDNVGEYEAEKLKLLEVNKAREQAIDLLEQERKERNENIIESGFSVYEEALSRQKEAPDALSGGIADSNRTKQRILSEAGYYFAEGLDEQISVLRKYNDTLKENRSNLDESSFQYGVYTEKIKIVSDAIEELKTQRDTDTKTIREYDKALAEEGKYYDKNKKQVLELTDLEKRKIELWQESIEYNKKSNEEEILNLEELAEQYDITADAVIEYQEAHEGVSKEDAILALIEEAEAAENTANTMKELEEAYKNAGSESSNLVSSIDKINSALKEQDENGSLAVSTQLELIDAGYGAALAYDKETGACKLNEKAVNALVEAKLQLQIANLENLRSSLVSTLLEEANSATVAAGAFLELAQAKSLASKAYVDRGGADPSKSYAGYGGNFGYLKLESDTVAKTEQQIKSLDKQIEALESTLGKVRTGGVKAFGDIGKSAGGAKNKTDELKKSTEELKSKYDKVISFITGRIDKHTKAIQKQKDTEVDAIEKIIKEREKQKDKELDAIEEQINALEKEKDAREKYWDDQIDALKAANDARKDALELQEKLDALEKAKNTKVKIYKEGQGFVYDVDQTAVAEAQKALDEYLSEKAYEDELERLEKLKDAEIDNYDKRLDALNNFKDNTQKSYEDQIAALEAQKEALEEQYDAQIEYYNNFKEQFEDMVKAYEDKQTELLAAELTGINFENDNWMTRLDNLAHFVSEYNKIQAQLNTGNTSVQNTATASTPSGGVGGGSGKGTTKATNLGGSSSTSTSSKNKGYSGSQSGSAGLQLSALSANRKRVLGYASGTPSVKEDEIAIVGENPNKEIVIGSKINNGELMNLGKGTGVVNADSSKTLAGLINQVGQFGSSGFGSGSGTLNNNINNDSLVVNGVTIQGSNIKDPESFANGLLNLKAEMLQRAYRHR